MKNISMLLCLFLLFLVVFNSGCVAPDASGTAGSGQKPGDIVIGLSLGTLKEERWQRDRDFFVNKTRELGAGVIVESANADAELQKSQVESLILQGVNVIVIVPENEELLRPLIEKAHNAGIKVLAYDRLINDVDLDAYVTFDYVKAGEQQALAVLNVAKKGNFGLILGDPSDSTVYMQKEGVMKVLQPEIDKGSVKLVFENFTNGWKPEVAYQTVKKYLEGSKDVDGVISLNDGMASGILQALNESGLKVPVSGMDAELAACQRIVDGTQTQTSYLPVNLQAIKAADVAVKLAKSQSVEFNGKVNNGKTEVPTYFLDPVTVTKENMMQTVIKDGLHSFEEVYVNVPADERPKA